MCVLHDNPAQSVQQGTTDVVTQSHHVIVQPYQTFNCGEFALIKIRVIDTFPNAKELNGIAVSLLFALN
jgi:hypothetical protein